MAEIVSSAFLSAILQTLFHRLTSNEVMNMFRGKKLIVKQLEELNIMLLSADKLLDYAEEKQIEDPKVKKWLDELKEVVYVAGELMDKVNNEALRSELEGESSSGMSKVLSKLIPCSLSVFDNAVRFEMDEILHKLKFLMKQRCVLGLKEIRENKHLNRLPPPLVEESDVYGRDYVKESIVESLLMDDHVSGDNISVIPIVGIGGIGKTTLAQLVYDDRRVREHFDDVIVWVTVSTEFDLFRITKTILEKVTSQTCGVQDLQDVRFRLKESLARKKFLLVLDDVWNENYEEWDVLRSSFVSVMRGSKIIVTTRSTTVASIMAIQQPHCLSELSEEDCWRIFTKHAFIINENLGEYSDLQEIGRKIVRNCKGNPLAVKSLGGMLHFERNPKKWNNLLKSNMWELNGKRSTGILPALWLSYYHLPLYLKPCFAYFSVFPKDFFFESKTIVQLWMAEGFLQSDQETAQNRIEDVGEQYFEDLLARSLLQRSNENESLFVMHDLVHDLATYVLGEFRFHLDDNNKPIHDFGSKTRHFLSNIAVDDLKNYEGLFEAKRLHTFIELAENQLREPADYLKPLMTIGCLRVLCLQGHFIKELPDSIGNLKNLRFFKLIGVGVVTLPDSVCTLYNLQTVILCYCRKIARLPINVGRLINLRHLTMRECSELRSLPDSICCLRNLQTLSLLYCGQLVRLPDNMGQLISLHHLDTDGSPLEEMPLHMGNLKDLETLSDFVLRKYGGSKIKELGELQKLRGTLRISGLQNVNGVEDAVKANLKDKKNLSVLALEWKGQTNDSMKERDLLQALQPPKNLREIIISGYGGTSFPLWVGNSAFSTMVSIKLYHCQNCCFVPPLGKLPSLRELKIYYFHVVETIGDEFYGGDSPFRSLETLSFENMPEWTKWSFVEGNKDGGFPRLKVLRLINCPKLSGWLPIHTTESLTIEKCGKLDIPMNHPYASFRKLRIERFHSLELFPLENAPKLNKLDLSDCASLESLTVLEKPLPVVRFLRSLWLSGCAKLVSFPKGGLPAPNLNDLMISQCKKLRSLPEQMHTLLPSLEILHVEDCPKIKSFPEGGLPSNLKHLQIWRCRKLVSTYMHWNLQRLTCLASLTIGHCEDVLDSFPPEGLLPTSVISFFIYDFPHLKALNSNAFQRLTCLGIYSCPKLQCLPNESFLSSLKSLDISECPLLEQRYREEKEEIWPKISHIPDVCIYGGTISDYESDTQ